MTKPERVAAALKGGAVDRVPVSAWWHDFPREWTAHGLAEAALEAYRKYDWDFMKVNPRFSYCAEPWGVEYTTYPDRLPTIATKAVQSPEDLARITSVDATHPIYAEQIEALRLIADGLGGEAQFIETVFSPLATMSFLTGSTKYVQRLMADHPAELEAALDAITQSSVTLVRAVFDTGASGIFYAAVEWGSSDHISWADYERFGKPYDVRILEAAAGAPLNVLHVCQQRNHLMRSLDYPVAAFNWDVHGDGNPGLAEVLAVTDKAVIGGANRATLLHGSYGDVIAESDAANEATGGRRWIRSPGCSIDPACDEANLFAMQGAVQR